MHPGDDADAIVGRARGNAGGQDGLRILDYRLPDNTDRNGVTCIEGIGNLLLVLRHLAECLLAVQILATGEEPDLKLVQCLQLGHSQLC